MYFDSQAPCKHRAPPRGRQLRRQVLGKEPIPKVDKLVDEVFCILLGTIPIYPKTGYIEGVSLKCASLKCPFFLPRGYGGSVIMFAAIRDGLSSFKSRALLRH